MWWSTNGSNWQQIETRDEFGDTNASCGPCANENLHAALNHWIPLYSNITLIRQRDTQMGWFNKGQTISDIYQDWLHFWHWPENQTALYPYSASGYDIDHLRMCCSMIDDKGGHGGLIVEASLAYHWPYNEPGVDYHFGAVLGYDSVKDMVLFANGDREPLPRGTGKPDWISLEQLAAGGIVGILMVWGVNMAVPSGWKDDGTTLTAPNGHTVKLGYRDHVLNAASWNSNLQPLEEARGVNAAGDTEQSFGMRLTWTHGTTTINEAGPWVANSPGNAQAITAIKEAQGALDDALTALE